MAAPIVIGLALRDDDAAPLALGTAMARLTGAPLALVAAFLHDPMPPPVPEPHLDALLLNAALAELEAHAERLRDEHEVTVHAHHGAPTRVLRDTCEMLDAALLVVGSSHRGHVGRVLAGSVTAGVLHGSSCAVAVAPRGYAQTHAFRRIAVAYDGSEESRDALTAARGLALFAGGSVHAYTVLEPCDWSPALMSPGWAVPTSYEQSRRARAERVAAEVQLAPDDTDVDSEVLIGYAGQALAALSRDFDLLVCGSRGYGALRSVALGGVSRTLVNQAGCPVLVLPRAPKHHHGWFAHRDAVTET